MNSTELPLNDPLFRTALAHFQKGEWKAGQDLLGQLTEKYPLDHELRTLRQEMALRAKVDEDEIRDNERLRKRQLKIWLTRFTIVVVLAAAAFFSLKLYSNWFRAQWTTAQAGLEAELLQAELKMKFENAEDLLRAGRVEDARFLLGQIAEQQADYPGLKAALATADQMNALDAQYQVALGLKENGDLQGALGTFQAIAEQEASYRDVQIQVSTITDQLQLSQGFAQAETAYQNEDWEGAIASYELIQQIDPNYQKELLDMRMYEAYVNAARGLLSSQPDSLPALEKADEYFRKALALRPQDEQVKNEQLEARESLNIRQARDYIEQAETVLVNQADSLEAMEAAKDLYQKALALRPDDADIRRQADMAQKYLRAEVNFEKGQWDNVIADLETVYSEDPQFAQGTARQILYEAYLGRGMKNVKSGQYELALADYQRAAALADESQEGYVLSLYMAQIRVAELQGMLGEYEVAGDIYRSALESLGLDEDALKQGDTTAAQQLYQAQLLLDRKNYKAAYKVFKQFARQAPALSMVSHEIKAGEYLVQLANKYHTTVEVILNANAGVDASDLMRGKTLLIPTLTNP